ncbi:MAG: FtsW/RodA/SpoVE family cell cycle protein [Eubacterium sp.]|nr:FtsW/RodA/SpoVE family cell cycle protein [Eubacterium sp.]
MVVVVADISRYILVLLIVIYVFLSFVSFKGSNEEKKNMIYRGQRAVTVLFFLVCSGVLILERPKVKLAVILGLCLLFYIVFIILYQKIYGGLSKLILNNMMLCLMVGFIMQIRLNMNNGLKQLLMASIAMALCLLVPYLIERFSVWEKLAIPYIVVGLLLLALVYVIGVEHYGAKNWIAIGGFELQPSEFVKIIYVFFIASMLSKRTDFKWNILVTCLAAAHVGILVLEKDLGGALIFFFTYLMMLYVATGVWWYILAGFGVGAGAAVVAYKLFSHVRIRVMAWRDPWSHINDAGYQICRSLFAIGTGGIMGMGLGQGLPQSVPVVESDFIFSAIAEELGVAFAICLVLVYISSFIMFVNIAMKMKRRFYKLCAFGLGVVLMFQVFICIGGATKFIPSTGVTLPLISYGGSSIIATIIIFAVIQGMYVLNDRVTAHN